MISAKLKQDGMIDSFNFIPGSVFERLVLPYPVIDTEEEAVTFMQKNPGSACYLLVSVAQEMFGLTDEQMI